MSTETPKKPSDPAVRKGMTDEERAIFEKNFKRDEEGLRRLAKL